jgi:glucuronate isomerase
MTEEASARPRKATGPDRPAYFTPADIDRVMAILLALISEVASIRDRLDTHERVAAGGAPATAELVEAYQPDEAAAADRETWRHAYIRRLFRVITEDIEALKSGEHQE